MNNSNNKVNSKSSYNIVNKEFKNNLKNKSKKIKKIKEEKILIGNKKKSNNKITKKFNFDLDLIDDNSLQLNFLSKKELTNTSNNFNKNKKNLTMFSSFNLNDKNERALQDNISNNLNFYNNKINKYFNNEFINKLKDIKIKDVICKDNKDINIDTLKNISLNVDIKEQKLNKAYQDYYNYKNDLINTLKEKGIQAYKNYNEIKKVLKMTQNEYDENKKKFEKKKKEINSELKTAIESNNNYQSDSSKALNELYFSYLTKKVIILIIINL
jgi:hypothetical protein